MKPRYNKFVSFSAALAATLPFWYGAQTAPTVEDLQKQIKALQQQIDAIKPAAAASKPEDVDAWKNLLKGKGLTIGFYGESKYRFPEAGANVYDPHRFVLAPSYQINDWLIFHSEIEFEHGGVDKSTSAHSRFGGEIEIEQFYVDALINPHFNLRLPGIDLIPVGRVNPRHEPTTFYSTERPELYREIIPSTWMEPAMSVFGKIVEDLNYRVMVSTGLEDDVGVKSNAKFSSGIKGDKGFRDARPRLNGASHNSLAYSGRLSYTGIRGLETSTSGYVTQVTGSAGNSTVSLWDIEASYRLPNSGWEVRGDFAHWWLSNPTALVANNNSDRDVGDRMYGWYGELAYHFFPDAWKKGKGSDMDIVPFVRYSQIVTQAGLPAGATKNTDGKSNKEFLTTGVAWFLNQNVVVKADYRHNFSGSPTSSTDGASQDYFQIGVGISF